MSDVGIINPGAMGVSIAASLKSAGHEVYWVSAGRSSESRERAAEHQLTDVQSLTELCARCRIILSVCPPHAAEAVAQSVIGGGFRGLYCDGNAIAPQKSRAIGATFVDAGIDFVDGSIVGPPAWQSGSTRFYLSGARAAEIADLFEGTLTEAIVIGDEIGRASALKMVFAAQTKGFTALVSAIQAAAESLGVRAELTKNGNGAIRMPLPTLGSAFEASPRRPGDSPGKCERLRRPSKQPAFRVDSSWRQMRCTNAWRISRMPKSCRVWSRFLGRWLIDKRNRFA